MQIGSYSGKGLLKDGYTYICEFSVGELPQGKKKYQFLEEYSYIQNSESDSETEDLLEIEDIPREEVLEMINHFPQDIEQF